MQLRNMTMADADKMLEWKNYFETRQFTIQSHDEISKEAHYKWLPDNLKYFKVIEIDGKPCGAVRVQENEISIWVDRDYRGKGIATFIIEQISEIGMIAHIVDGNVGSMKCFIRAGFEPIKYVITTKSCNYYIFKK